jgi:hypothetical protein
MMWACGVQLEFTKYDLTIGNQREVVSWDIWTGDCNCRLVVRASWLCVFSI